MAHHYSGKADETLATKRERNRAWIKEHPDRNRAAVKKWAEAHPEEAKRWAKENPIRIAAQSAAKHAKRRAKLRGNEVHGREESSAIIDLYVRARCLSERTGVPHEVDHIVPIARGGGHVLSNLQIITKGDHTKKSDAESYG